MDPQKTLDFGVTARIAQHRCEAAAELYRVWANMREFWGRWYAQRIEPYKRLIREHQQGRGELATAIELAKDPDLTWVSLHAILAAAVELVENGD